MNSNKIINEFWKYYNYLSEENYTMGLIICSYYFFIINKNNFTKQLPYLLYINSVKSSLWLVDI